MKNKWLDEKAVPLGTAFFCETADKMPESEI